MSIFKFKVMMMTFVLVSFMQSTTFIWRILFLYFIPFRILVFIFLFVSFFRSNPQTIKFFEKTVSYTSPVIDDQTAMRRFLQDKTLYVQNRLFYGTKLRMNFNIICCLWVDLNVWVQKKRITLWKWRRQHSLIIGTTL
jgi:hypothetical protein